MSGNRHILLIEDDRLDARFVLRSLNTIGSYKTEHRSNLEMGIDALDNGSFDLILLDLGLPDSHGDEAIFKLKPYFTRTPVVVLTGQKDKDVALQSLREGVQDYLVKGEISSIELQRCISYAIERHHLYRAKDEFVSIVSHELRTPMTSIRGSLGLVLGNGSGEISDQVREVLEIAQRNCERLGRLIDDLLDIQKLEAGKMNLVFGPIHVPSMIEKAMEANAGYALDHEVTFLYEASAQDDELYVSGDEDRLLQVLSNLLSNAAKFSQARGEVTIALALEGDDQVRISVTDDGPGITEAFQDSVFEKFIQTDSSTTRSVKGTGLGLSICKSIVTLHCGQIGLTSTPGAGATFYFLLPLQSAAHSSAVDSSSTDAEHEELGVYTGRD